MSTQIYQVTTGLVSVYPVVIRLVLEYLDTTDLVSEYPGKYLQIRVPGYKNYPVRTNSTINIHTISPVLSVARTKP